MPFDSAHFVIDKPRTVADLGLTPIAEERAAQWRELVLQRFSDSNLHNQELVMTGLARWVRGGLMTADEFALYHRHAPRDVQDLVRRVAQIPNTLFAVVSFDKDPLVYAYGEDRTGYTERLCLAIWDKGVVRAIADGATLSKTQRFLRRFVTTV